MCSTFLRISCAFRSGDYCTFSSTKCIDINVELVGNNKVQKIRLISADPLYKPPITDEVQRDLRLYIEVTGVRLKDGTL